MILIGTRNEHNGGKGEETIACCTRKHYTACCAFLICFVLTYGDGHACRIFSFDGFYMKLHHEHPDEMHGEGVRVIIADGLLRFFADRPSGLFASFLNDRADNSHLIGLCDRPSFSILEESSQCLAKFPIQNGLD